MATKESASMQGERTPGDGFCHCGCGGLAPLAQRTDNARGYKKGKPVRYIRNHQRRGVAPANRSEDLRTKHRAIWLSAGIDYGLCLCGCGQRTVISLGTTSARDNIAGEPVKYVRGHSWRSAPTAYKVEDCGYATPCWVWQLARDSDGYGSGNGARAHVIYYEAARGSVPPDLELDHLCRVRACVNPDHLEPVTHAENCRRGAKAKLSMVAAHDIRARYAHGGISQTKLAEEYGVNQTTISMVILNRIWTA